MAPDFTARSMARPRDFEEEGESTMERELFTFPTYAPVLRPEFVLKIRKTENRDRTQFAVVVKLDTSIQNSQESGSIRAMHTKYPPVVADDKKFEFNFQISPGS
uniref:Uncharacterized protein n=1 Tax=Psilocybe cubensis TaxID=181762 RepID=A0A8H7XME4_PSICU